MAQHLFTADRMGTIADGFTSLLTGREPSPPPSRVAAFLIYTVLLGIVAIQLGGIARSGVALRRRRLPDGRLGARLRIGLALAANLGWALFVLALVPKQSGWGSASSPKGCPMSPTCCSPADSSPSSGASSGAPGPTASTIASRVEHAPRPVSA